ncbi:hypothetical protein OKA05_25700 [Luteolibacter arcticus]|uniref:Uncharacterized protein n=1 Tax=Luteolibacter arcticus TaxID=1581411 RepID=A0ABT3GR56_9BACT|nr:hypothetical protein [Luteolibacter arcticus]MCW1925980.1 hypothetical protein [Luteolibacter arcticus]
MLGALKDNLASRAAKSVLAGRIERYGQLNDLRIRSKEKMLLVEVMLTGETEEILIVVDRYRILPADGGKIAIVIEAITVSREWLQLLLEDFVVGQAIPIPAVAAMALGKPDSSVPVSSSTSARPS